MEYQVEKTEEFTGVAKDILSSLRKEDGATLITLSGELGAGKTTLSQAIGRELGVTDTMVSPTFVLEKVYDLQDQVYARLIHIDAYRLTGEEELHAIGFEDILLSTENLILLEWPEKVAGALPPVHTAVSITVNEDSSRTVHVYENS